MFLDIEYSHSVPTYFPTFPGPVSRVQETEVVIEPSNFRTDENSENGKDNLPSSLQTFYSRRDDAACQI